MTYSSPVQSRRSTGGLIVSQIALLLMKLPLMWVYSHCWKRPIQLLLVVLATWPAGEKRVRNLLCVSHTSELDLYQKETISNKSQTNAGLGREHYWLFLITLGKTWSNSFGKLWHFFFSSAILTALWDIKDSSKSYCIFGHKIETAGQRYKPHNTQHEQKSLWKIKKKKTGNKLSFSSQCLSLTENMLSNRPGFLPLSPERISLLSIKHTFTMRIALDSSRHRSVFSESGEWSQEQFKMEFRSWFPKAPSTQQLQLASKGVISQHIWRVRIVFENQAIYLGS